MVSGVVSLEGKGCLYNMQEVFIDILGYLWKVQAIYSEILTMRYKLPKKAEGVTMASTFAHAH